MKVTFLKPGKYKNGIPVLVVSEEDVKANKVFDVFDSNAIEFVDAGSAKKYIPKEAPGAKDFDSEVPKKAKKPKSEKADAPDSGK